MAGILFKWLFISLAYFPLFKGAANHPIFVSVTEIEHNAKEKTLEVSCKIFTDDFEKTLRTEYKVHVDLLDEKIRPTMDKVVNDYVQRHLKISADGKLVPLKYLGYEKIDEGIYSYFEASNIPTVQKLEVTDNVLLEFNTQQINLVHATVNGNRKSSKLSGAENKVTFQY